MIIKMRASKNLKNILFMNLRIPIKTTIPITIIKNEYPERIGLVNTFLIAI